MRRAHPGAGDHEIDPRDEAGPVRVGRTLDDGHTERLHRAHADVVAAVAGILFDHRHLVAATRARPSDSFTRGPQPDDQNAPGHSMTPGMLMKS